jgi:hypothetical protein
MDSVMRNLDSGSLSVGVAMAIDSGNNEDSPQEQALISSAVGALANRLAYAPTSEKYLPVRLDVEVPVNNE